MPLAALLRDVPVVTYDELGFIAGHTNLMIEGLKEHLRLTKSLEVTKEIQSLLLPKDSSGLCRH